MLCNSAYRYIFRKKNNIKSNKYYEEQSPNYTMNLIKYHYNSYKFFDKYAISI